MSQNSLVLPTSGTLSGLAAVEAINAAVDTLNTLASGSSAPSSPEAGQFWHDTGNKLIKIRSMDNTTWIVIGTLDETNYLFNTQPQPTIWGLRMSNDSTTPNSIIDIAAGGAFDTTASVYMRLSSALTKNVLSAFVAGTGHGSLDTGTITSSKFYFMHLIFGSSGADILTSLSFTSPTLPAGYSYSAPIGAFLVNASGNVEPFFQLGNTFLYVTGKQDEGSDGTSGALTLSVPSGTNVRALVRAGLVNSGGVGSSAGLLLQSPYESSQTDTPPDSSEFQTLLVSGQTGYSSGEFSIITNTSAQIVVTLGGTSASKSFSIWTKGFELARGLQ